MNLNIFNTTNLFEAATNLFQQLNIKLNSITTQPIPTKEILKHHYKDNATFNAIKKTYFLGIIDDSVFRATGLFDTNYSYKQAIEQGDKNYNGLMLFALQLKKLPTRTEISELTRAFNRISQKMPVALLLKYPPTSLLEDSSLSEVRSFSESESLISIAISERFKYLQNWRQGEKAGKVIILRDIRTQNTHAGHIRILQDLVKPKGITTYDQLHQHWLQVLDVSILNKKFFQELSNWYFAAMNEVSFPNDLEKNEEIRNATNLIRLITRVIFIWFIKEKQLVPASLFRKDFVAGILKDFNKNKKSHNYYNAILQNLFFGTLNQKMEDRDFISEKVYQGKNPHYNVTTLYRYADLFTISKKEVKQLFKDIPFLNGGLFDCLDKPNEIDETEVDRVDGFTSKVEKRAIIPDHLFFGEEKEVDLNKVYGTKGKHYKFRGLINLLESYKFTVAENTPIEEEIALDPELLGKVFENLLASYNPETQTTARKQTGSFYTPREIVNYMVDESLLEYLKGTLTIFGQAKNTPTIPGPGQTTLYEYHCFFNPENEIDIHRGNLPHWQQDNVWYFVTFRLADSIPKEAAEQLKAERELWLLNNKKNNKGEYTNEQKKEYYRLFSDRIEQLLNNGKGSCVLKSPQIARIVVEALEYFDNKRYMLDEWVIMPNHVHVLVKPIGKNRLPEIMHSWKSFTANEINKVLGIKGQLWMHESYDHIVRNERAFEAIRQYIIQNPIKAGLKEGDYLLRKNSTPTETGDCGNMDTDRSMDRSRDASDDTLEGRLRSLISYTENTHPFNETETRQIIEALNNCKILDPACGSGAFPMGILHKMVHILQKLDPENKYWKEVQRESIIGAEIRKLEQDKKAIEGLSDAQVREKALQAVKERLNELEDIFNRSYNFDDYSRKLYLIENCIYGIDIQPIAVQIAKLRFFISLVIDQKVNMDKENFGIRSLPNLETKFVAANTLIGLEVPTNDLFSENNPIKKLENKLKAVRHEYFTSSTRNKKLELQKKDKELRKKIASQISDTLINKKEEDIKNLEKQLSEAKQKLVEFEAAPEQKETIESTNIFGETETTVIDKKKEKIKAQKSTISSIEKQINSLKSAYNKDAIQKVAQQISSFDPYDQNHAADWFDPEWMFGITDGFDIVMGNPPYISTKGVDDKDKKILEKNFGFADDTYNHFYFKGIALLKPNGILAYISSKTFWTIQTKKNLRELLLKNKIIQIFDTANPFASAMVDTCVMVVQKQEALKNHEIVFLDGRNNLAEPEKYTVQQEVYQNAPNEVFFIPSDYNMKIYEKLGKTVNKLITEWWDKISTSKNIEKNKRILEEYRKNLKPGDVTLLGLITEGGQGLATANNGKYIGVLNGTKWAEKVRNERPEKLLLAKEFCKKQKIATKYDAQSFLENLNEQEIRQLFDQIKEQFGRDIFGQGWLYRIVSRDEIADVEKLSDDEKLNGINGNKTFVPYDKGDKEGNRWYAPTPYYIDWSRENVRFLRENSGKKGEGMPVVRNPQFYFREGFCWTDVNSTYLKSRLKENGIYDVLTMSLFSITYLPDWYFVSLINSKFISEYVDDFVNTTSHFQINDARQLPIIIPTPSELAVFEKIFNRAYTIQKQKFEGVLTETEAEKELEEVQRELDELVIKLYNL